MGFINKFALPTIIHTQPIQRMPLNPTEQAFQTFEALQNIAQEYNRTFPLDGGIAGKKKNIILGFKFLAPNDEQSHQAKDYIQHHRSENLKILQEAQKLSGLRLTGNQRIAVGVGSYYSVIYTNNNGYFSSFQFRIGCKIDYNEAELNRMINKIAELRSYELGNNFDVIFFDAISYVPANGAIGVDYGFSKFKDDVSYEATGKNIKAGVLAESIRRKMNELGIAGGIYHIGKKKAKLLNKWTNSIVHNFQEFEQGALGFIVDIGSSSFSLKLAVNNNVDDAKNLIELVVGKGEDEYQDHDAICDYYEGKGSKEPGDIHPSLVAIFDKLITTAQTWLEMNASSREKLFDDERTIGERIQEQPNFHVVVRGTGRLRDVYFDAYKKVLEARKTGFIYKGDKTAEGKE